MALRASPGRCRALYRTRGRRLRGGHDGNLNDGGLESSTERRTAAVVGVLFIIATVGSIAGSAVLGSALDGPDYLAGLSAEAGRVTAAVLCFLVAAT